MRAAATRLLRDRPPPLLLLEEVELRFQQVILHLYSVAELEVRLVLRIVRRPLRQALAVRIAGGREGDPVARHLIAEPTIDIGRPRPLADVVERVLDLRGMFTFVNTLLFRPLSGRAAELIGVYSHDTTQADSYRSFAYPGFADIRDRNDVFDDVIAFTFALTGKPVDDVMQPGSV